MKWEIAPEDLETIALMVVGSALMLFLLPVEALELWSLLRTPAILLLILAGLFGTGSRLARRSLEVEADRRQARLQWRIWKLELPATFIPFDEVEDVRLGGWTADWGPARVDLRLKDERSIEVFSSHHVKEAARAARLLADATEVDLSYASQRLKHDADGAAELVRIPVRIREGDLTVRLPPVIGLPRLLSTLLATLGWVLLWELVPTEYIDSLPAFSTDAVSGLLVRFGMTALFGAAFLILLRFGRPAELRAHAGSLLIRRPTWGRARSVELQRPPRFDIHRRRLLLRRVSTLVIDDDRHRVTLDTRAGSEELAALSDLIGQIHGAEVSL